MAKSALSSLIPLIILFVVIAVGGAIGFVVYTIANDVADKTSQKMEKHNVSFSKGGMKVGVKHRTEEQMGDNTQSVLMKVWNSAAWPAYKSRLGWGQTTSAGPADAPTTQQRNPYSRSSSAQSTKKA